MSTTTIAPTSTDEPRTGSLPRPPLPPRASPPMRFVRETALLIARSLRMIPRVPERLSDVTVQPVIFTLLFLYVFGSAIHIAGIRYQDYLLPGLLGQSLAFGVIGAGTSTSTDFASGVIDRFKSLPVTRLSVITAQVVGQLVEQVLSILIVAGLGLALGWRPDFGVAGGFELVGLMLLGLAAFTWFGVLLGMLVRSSDAMQGLGFAIVLPLSFLGGTFVPIAGMKLVFRAIGEWDPISSIVAALRQVSQGYRSHGSLPLDHPVAAMCAWCVLIMAVCVPLALRRFSSSTR